jgi:hypothetical protein
MVQTFSLSGGFGKVATSPPDPFPLLWGKGQGMGV